jgi:hypothetical protein
MNRKSIAITAVLTMTALFTTISPFSMRDAKGQSLPPCPVGYERNILGTCVPIVNPDPEGGDSDGTETETEQNIVCSGWSYTCG